MISIICKKVYKVYTGVDPPPVIVRAHASLTINIPIVTDHDIFGVVDISRGA